MTRFVQIAATSVLLVLLAAAQAFAQAGGGSSGFSGGGGGGGGGGGSRGGGGGSGSGSDGGSPLLFLIIAVAVLLSIGLPLLRKRSLARTRAARDVRVSTASAEAAEDDPVFAADVVKTAAAKLYCDIQQAWSARDVAALVGCSGRTCCSNGAAGSPTSRRRAGSTRCRSCAARSWSTSASSTARAAPRIA